MFEVACPACQSTLMYDPEDYIHLCPVCSSGFVMNLEEGHKELVGDHFLIPSTFQKDDLKNIFYDWLKDIQHKKEVYSDEYKILGSYSIFLPFWVVFVEAHTHWAGDSKKQETYPGQPPYYKSQFVWEEGQFSRRYRWTIYARKSPKEHWGIDRLHNPREAVKVDWDGFPLDDSMGTVPDDVPEKNFYKAKGKFNFEKTLNISVAGVQMKESQALVKAKNHIQEYHRRIAKTKVGSLQEYNTEVEVMGLHLLHIPFYIVCYTYQPKNLLRLVVRPKEYHLIVQGYTKTILNAEVPMKMNERAVINAGVCAGAATLSGALAILLHPSFFIFMLLFIGVVMGSVFKVIKHSKEDLLDQDLIAKKISFGAPDEERRKAV